MAAKPMLQRGRFWLKLFFPLPGSAVDWFKNREKSGASAVLKGATIGATLATVFGVAGFVHAMGGPNIAIFNWAGNAISGLGVVGGPITGFLIITALALVGRAIGSIIGEMVVTREASQYGQERADVPLGVYLAGITVGETPAPSKPAVKAMQAPPEQVGLEGEGRPVKDKLAKETEKEATELEERVDSLRAQVENSQQSLSRSGAATPEQIDIGVLKEYASTDGEERVEIFGNTPRENPNTPQMDHDSGVHNDVYDQDEEDPVDVISALAAVKSTIADEGENSSSPSQEDSAQYHPPTHK